MFKNNTSTVDNDSLGVEDLVPGDGSPEGPGVKFETVTSADAEGYKWSPFATVNSDMAFFVTLEQPEFEEIFTADGSEDVTGDGNNDTYR